jgi:hypothetical protein
MKKGLKRFIISFALIIILLLVFILTGYHNLRFRAGVWMTNRNTPEQERMHGVRPVFTDIPGGWSRPMKQDMNHIWKPLNLKGMNYFSFGAPKHFFSKYAERSNPFSRFYQAWFGVYVIQADTGRFGIPRDNLEIEELGKLAEFDQRAWLRAMGDTLPEATWTGFIRQDRILINGQPRQCYEGTIVSHSDLSGSKSNRLINLFGMPPQERWEDEVAPFHDITLKGIYGGWYSVQYNVTIVFYGCGSIVTTRSGEKIDHYSEILNDLIRLAEGVKLVPVEEKD